MTTASWALLVSVYVACVVESVEAATIVMAMGFTRGWRSAMAGVVVALGVLAVFTAAAGYALATWLHPAALKLAIGALLLIFGLQWLRKAIYRFAGRKSMHDETGIYATQVAVANAAGGAGSGFDSFGFFVSFKGALLEGLEVVFIVLTFGLTARAAGGYRIDPLWIAAVGAAAAILTVLAIAVAVRKPLAMIPENALKYGVGLLLVAFGTYWSVGGLGIFFGAPDGLSWPGADLAILYLLAAEVLLTQVLIRGLRKSAAATAEPQELRQ